jgi:hypothetical protein
MDTLHNVLRAIRGETKSRGHLTVFREFLGHLDRAAKRAKGVKAIRTPRKPARKK